MLTLRPMRSDEFPGYLGYFVPDYTDEIATNYGLTPTDARSQAERETARDLPLGAETTSQTLLCIEDGSTLLGYLWINVADGIAFINDFHILPAHQGQGHGKAALLVLRMRLASDGVTQIRLRVAAGNPRAQALYQRMGFRTTGINMCLTL